MTTAKKIMVTGASGQIGSELVNILTGMHGPENVIATDIKKNTVFKEDQSIIFEFLDVTHKDHIEKIITQYGINTIYHMSAILSATGEKNPQLAWNVNVNGTYYILEAARTLNVSRLFIPSSIAVFGPETPRERAPQDTILRPRTIYGVTKVSGELLCEYYVQHFGMDIRGCRYPGIISYTTPPGGGTTDYAVAIFYEAVKNKKYTCFVEKETRLPMMYMPDCLKASIDLMEADFSRLKHHAGFNIAGMSFSAGELADEIKKHIPGFVCEYKPDFRQKIADSWPRTIDDSAAREEWDWIPSHDLSSMTADMLRALKEKNL
jgi:nucleoside-diphosphate-sugar epimerase